MPSDNFTLSDTFSIGPPSSSLGNTDRLYFGDTFSFAGSGASTNADSLSVGDSFGLSISGQSVSNGDDFAFTDVFGTITFGHDRVSDVDNFSLTDSFEYVKSISDTAYLRRFLNDV